MESEMGRLHWIIQVGPIRSYESLITDNFYGLWSERNVMREEGPEKCNVTCFENGGRRHEPGNVGDL